MYALTRIKGVGRRYSNLVCKKADVDLNKRYAQLYSRIRRTAHVHDRKITTRGGRRTRRDEPDGGQDLLSMGT